MKLSPEKVNTVCNTATSVACGWARAVIHVRLRAVAQKSFEEKHFPLLQLTKRKIHSFAFIFWVTRFSRKIEKYLLVERDRGPASGARWIFPLNIFWAEKKRKISFNAEIKSMKLPVFISRILVRPCVQRFRGWIFGYRQQGLIGTGSKWAWWSVRYQ